MEKEREENVLSFFKTKNGDGKEGKPFCRGKKIGKGKHIVEFFFGVGKDSEKEISDQ